ncbi:helix-turn-helix domain-containing protein [Streptomyces sp. NPDC002573]|uniref:DUF6197 family protein n=1 Tax=Streptomyces sp. NPDC002573 TaxID=3364651 RepID=UPI00367EF0BA
MRAAERERLKLMAYGHKTEYRLRMRAQIVLQAARGRSNARIARESGLHLDTVRCWRGRFADQGLGDRDRSGRPPAFTALQTAEVKAVACRLPAETGAPLSRWSAPELAREAVARGIATFVSASTVRRWLAQDALKPWQHRSWIFITDPDFRAKAQRVLDLYARTWQSQPLGEDEYVISADETTSIQARCRCHPTLAPGQARAMRVNHTYSRGGALAYLATHDVHAAKVFGRTEPRTGIAPFMNLVTQVMTQEPYASAKRGPALAPGPGTGDRLPRRPVSSSDRGLDLSNYLAIRYVVVQPRQSVGGSSCPSPRRRIHIGEPEVLQRPAYLCGAARGWGGAELRAHALQHLSPSEARHRLAPAGTSDTSSSTSIPTSAAGTTPARRRLDDPAPLRRHCRGRAHPRRPRAARAVWPGRVEVDTRPGASLRHRPRCRPHRNRMGGGPVVVSLSVTRSRIADVLTRSADLLEAEGWDPERNSMIFAIDRAAGYVPGKGTPDAEQTTLGAWDALVTHLGQQFAFWWEKTPGRTQLQVVTALRAAAEEVRSACPS